MAPKGGRGRSKAEKKKKEDKVLPVALDITVKLPDEALVILKGISTDRIVDVRRLLCENTITCYLTSYSLSHEVRGPRLKDSIDVVGLKPCLLTLVEEDYLEGGAITHVRRLLDIVSCISFFGTASPQKDVPPLAIAVAANKEGKRANSGIVVGKGDRNSGNKNSPTSDEASAEVEAEISGDCPRLSAFYEFFSLAHLAQPLQFVRRAKRIRQDGQAPEKDHLFFLEAKLCNGKLVLVEACARGFYSVGKLRILCHGLVDLLKQLSKPFDKAYEDLMSSFLQRNKFGNFPYGYRANTWLVPPLAAQFPSIFPSLPTEDEDWGGNGGGWARDAKFDLIPWATKFRFIAAMPCKTAEERQIRDRKAFLLHTFFVDVAIFKAIAATNRAAKMSTVEKDGVLLVETVGELIVTVFRDTLDASHKFDTKIDGTRTTGLDCKLLIERNLLKGISADENTTAHDVCTLGVVNIRFCGHIAAVKINYPDIYQADSPSRSFDIEDQPEGSNALNINSFRMLLHKGPNFEHKRASNYSKISEQEDQISVQSFAEKVLLQSLTKLESEEADNSIFFRWELGACWVEHLQDQKKAEKDKKQVGDKGSKNTIEKGENEIKIVGLGKPLKFLKNSKIKDANQEECKDHDRKSSHSEVRGENQNFKCVDTFGNLKGTDSLCTLKGLLPDSAILRLKEADTGLHLKSLQELTDMALKYYNEVALSKLVADFGSLELSPVDGRTLTDFMHTRGLRMRSLGQIVKRSEKLPHVQSLCIHEMIVRAFKHIMRAVIAAAFNSGDLALLIAATFNLLFGISQTENNLHVINTNNIVWKWLEVFLKKRYGWELTEANYYDVRKYAILRGLCQKVGIEIVARDFDLNSFFPFQKSDIISLVPVHKQAACSSADGRLLLESSKTALDKGKLENAVCYGTKALAKLIAVCGPYHRMTAGAYSLLAVVLYHTGDFNQATIYQQKALNINERELGFDHPDTMKSYGDLAVFYYRLQHTELALKYVKRAMYLLHLTCGSSHPNSAATYINVAMMEEGLGNVHVALRYLHKALKCNQRLLGSDHIQTAATYHAIAIALSLMEAYQLSVQHEQTTLQILKAKLGPDDLRTQDTAAWLEYFESKVFEQQEAVRNGTKKPDASIASKGHLSVSDLLDYINPNQEIRRKEAELIKKRSLSWKVKNRSSHKLNSQDLSEPCTESELTNKAEVKIVIEYKDREFLKEVHSLYIEHNDEGKLLKEGIVATQQSEEAIEEPTVVKTQTEESIETEEGWQPVHWPRSAGSSRQKLKQLAVVNGKPVYYKKDDPVESVSTKLRYSFSNCCWALKKRTVACETSDCCHSGSQSTRFGHKIDKAGLYRLTAPSTCISGTTNCSSISSERLNSPLNNEVILPSVHMKGKKNLIGEFFEPQKNMIVSIRTSLSYKDVALAQPRTVSKFQIREDPKCKDLNKNPSTGENGIEVNKFFLTKSSPDGGHAPIELMNRSQKIEGLLLNSAPDGSLEELESFGQEVVATPRGSLLMHGNVMEALQDNDKCNNIGAERNLEIFSSDSDVSSSIDGLLTDIVPGSIMSNDPTCEQICWSDECVTNSSDADSCKICDLSVSPETTEKCVIDELSISTVENATVRIDHHEDLESINSSNKSDSQDDDERLSLNVCDARSMPCKKLSALAPPFNPSPTSVLNPISKKDSFSSDSLTAPTQWRVIANLHTEPCAPAPCGSHNHPYYHPSTHPTRIMPPLPFIYPPYTSSYSQPHPRPPNVTVSMSNSMFHPNHYSWHSYMNPNASEFTPGALPVDIYVTSPVLCSISESKLENINPSDNANFSNMATQVNSNVGETNQKDLAETKAIQSKIVAQQISEAVKPDSVEFDKHTDNEKEPKLKVISKRYADSIKEKRTSQKYDNGNFSIFVKGRSRRRQSVRLPISLINKPCGPQSFKFIYNRVVRRSYSAKQTEVPSKDVHMPIIS